ncbi:hypothetical protein AKJ44_02950 [candidate division MSBL1 archaeon SCGC-AAA261F17]|uniref:ASCH domain-containing protein n=1 Tax=candidate division MSBL1 archaeon SCGC-AAA261F17 TaxID=1698274 RepID=A0A133V3S3_9EURY|nr:hypothetical protein AKJ44_02950 [candidate division MSBL1 archaeon SCGC-AAA261F17]
MPKRIWFKPDCIKWIREGIKTTTFRNTKRNGVYDVAKGSWFNATPIGLRLKLTPTNLMSGENVINKHYEIEGQFKSPQEFRGWLEKVGLELPTAGWLNEIKVLTRGE